MKPGDGRSPHAALDRRHTEEMLRFERALWNEGVLLVAGVDEAGIGPLAGPVFAAAVVFPPVADLPPVNDSKLLSRKARENLEPRICREARSFGVGVAYREEIDRVNIYRAGLLAMKRAVAALSLGTDHLLVDGRTIPDVEIPQTRIIKGDRLSLSIAAASILAKNHRDRYMEALDKEFPGYGFAEHKGYGTSAHIEALRRLGPCPEHRMSFPVVRELTESASALYQTISALIETAETAEEVAAARRQLRCWKKGLNEAEYRRLHTRVSKKVTTAEPALPLLDALDAVYHE